MIALGGELKNVSIIHNFPDGFYRTLGTVPMLRDGKNIKVGIVWQSQNICILVEIFLRSNRYSINKHTPPVIFWTEN